VRAGRVHWARYALHNGSGDPGPAAGRVRNGPAVARAERRQLPATFNGGFKLSAGTAHRGRGRLGLVGATLGGGEYVARGALGQDGNGNLMFAAARVGRPAAGSLTGRVRIAGPKHFGSFG
jgi:hypothetical protein